MSSLPPILAAPLLSEVEAKLLELLRSLTPQEWSRPTLAPQWSVRQVAAHLLDTHLRKLSMVRDGFFAEMPRIDGPASLTKFVNRMNQEGVAIYSRFSTPVLLSLLESAARESCEFHLSLDPFARATFAVSWAGESESLNWFDTARELTERWHHQQQIRVAVNRPGILTRELYHPVLDCFLRVLPFTYRDVEAPVGTVVQVHIAGECGGDWNLHRETGGWMLQLEPEASPTARAVIPQEIAWRLFTKGISRAEADPLIVVEGDPRLTAPIFSAIAIVG
ncbi:MAG: maleylpyruvate isomerase family mycothiol-dependent enzyme [Bryobacteraceae bacterium]